MAVVVAVTVAVGVAGTVAEAEAEAETLADADALCDTEVDGCGWWSPLACAGAASNTRDPTKPITTPTSAAFAYRHCCSRVRISTFR